MGWQVTATVREAASTLAASDGRPRRLVRGDVWRLWVVMLWLISFGVVGAWLLARRRHRTATGRLLSLSDTGPPRWIGLVVVHVIGLTMLALAGVGTASHATAESCTGRFVDRGSAEALALHAATARPTGMSVLWARAHDGTLCRGADGLLLARMPDGGYARAGTTVGSVFLTGEGTVRDPDSPLIDHEQRHVEQWAIGSFLGGPFAFPLAYVTAESVLPESRNVFEQWAGLGDGGYDVPEWPGPGPSRIALAVVVLVVVVVERRALRRVAASFSVTTWPPAGLTRLRNPQQTFHPQDDLMLSLRGTPRLHDDSGPRRTDTGDRHASWLELLFDLVVAVTIIELAQALLVDLTWQGLGRTLLHLVPVWWLWEGFTWYADRYDADDLLYRALFAVGIGGFAAMPLTLDNTSHFVVAFLVAEGSLTTLYAYAARRYPATAGFAWTCVALFLAGMSCWALSLALPEPSRYGLWAAGLGLEILAPLVAGGVVAAMPARARHIPERLGLLTLVSLGGMVLVTLDRLQIADTSSVAAKVLAFAVLLLLWHLYFDHVDGTAIHAGHWPRVVYNYASLFVLAGVVLTGVGVARTLTSPDGAELPLPVRLALTGGVGLYAAALAANAAVSQAASRARVRDSRAAAALAACSLAIAPLTPVLALAAIFGLLGISAVVTTRGSASPSG